MEYPKQQYSHEKYLQIKAIFKTLIAQIKLSYNNPEIQNFYIKIKEKYPQREYENCLLWHLILGSTPHDVDIYYDTPEGDIEDFILNKLPTIIENQK